MSTLLATNAVEAAPARLLAALGKLALTGATETRVAVESTRKQGHPSGSPVSGPSWKSSRGGRLRLTVSLVASVVIVGTEVFLFQPFDRPPPEPIPTSSLGEPIPLTASAAVPAFKNQEPKGTRVLTCCHRV